MEGVGWVMIRMPRRRKGSRSFSGGLMPRRPLLTSKRLTASSATSSNAVEDELTTIPFDPANWRNDGRMYPPQMDGLRAVPGRSDVRRFRSRSHNTLIAINGAIEIRELSDRAIFSKPGADGQTV